MTDDKFKIGKTIYINTGTATAHCAIAVSGTIAQVINTSEKAVELSAYTENNKHVTFWLPKKALKFQKSHNTYEKFDLMHWFRPTGWTAKALEITRQVSMVSA